MKKTLITIGLLAILSTTASASWFNSFSYGQSLDDRVITDDNGNDIIFKNAQSLELKMGTQHFPNEESDSIFGGYMGVELGQSDETTHIYQGKEEKFENAMILINVGLTYALNNYILVFGGAGVSIDTAVAQLEGTEDYEHFFKENKLNVNGGLIVYLYESKLGVIMEYDSVPNAVNIGLAYRW